MGSPPNNFGEVISVDAGRYHSVAVVQGGQDPRGGSGRIKVQVGSRSLGTIGSSVNFGEAAAGAKGRSITFRVSNIGISAVSGLRISVLGARRPDFLITRFPSRTIPVAGTTSFRSRFRPSAKGVRKAFLFLKHGDASTNVVSGPFARSRKMSRYFSFGADRRTGMKRRFPGN